MTIINHKTFMIAEMIRNSYHMISDNLAQTIEIIINSHNENMKIENITKVEIVSVINQRTIIINH